jgi:protease-4
MFASMLGLLLTFVLIAVLLIGIITSIAKSGEKEVVVSDNSILHINFKQQIRDRGSKNPFENFNIGSLTGERTMGLDDILKNIRKAKNDAHIKGIYLDLTSVPAGIATLEEIRSALIDFKNSGKFIISYSEMYTQATYYLATVADKIYLNPQGLLEFKGLSAEVMFFKGALEKLDIEPQIIRHGQFKSAIEPLILDKMSEANRKQTMTYMGSIWNHILKGISERRKLSIDELNRLANEMSIQNASDAVKYKLADQLVYEDEVIADLKKRTGRSLKDKLDMVTLSKYTDVSDNEPKSLSMDKIAIVYATGSIESGKGDDNTIGSERIAKAIRDAREDEKVKAIVLRVNSPGGSALASEVIWREVALARKQKPVVASMGDVAASGGYYISCAANKIVASPNTITGSIGVFGVLFNGQKLLNEKLGITIDTVKTNTHADIGSVYRPLTAAERAVVQKGVEDIYTTFITRVAEGRKKTVAEVDSIGQGRVWSGEDALKIGLVDEIGGLNKAIAIAAKLAKLDKYRISSLPEQKEAFEELMSNWSDDAEAKILEKKLGASYKYYDRLNGLLKMQGIQARMPYAIDIY